MKGADPAAGIACFLIAPTYRARVYLRRLSAPRAKPCPLVPAGGGPAGAGWGHDARTEIPGAAPPVLLPREVACGGARVAADGTYVVDGRFVTEPTAGGWPVDDARWPDACACGYVFGEDDARLVWCEKIYVRPQPLREYVLPEAPPGAMWYDDWSAALGPHWRGPDGRCLVVQTPAGHSYVDLRPEGAPPARFGEPPRVTVPVPIVGRRHGEWRGWLRAGTLLPDSP